MRERQLAYETDEEICKRLFVRRTGLLFWSRKWEAASLATELLHLDHEREQDGFVCTTRPHLKGAARWRGVPGARATSSATSAQLRQDAPYRLISFNITQTVHSYERFGLHLVWICQKA